ncbi:Chemotaxis protein CheY [Thiorhodovibrio winogradskyi]|uniref:Chemotaxis protein CheY n=2 Tax=Thiorhodovibrio winogradskyi TaxID=77007 RepID=A0ABZ0S6H5_9GAMM
MKFAVKPAQPQDIVRGRALPYHLYLADRTPLAFRGQIINEPDRIDILHRCGWRQIGGDERLPTAGISGLEAKPPVHPASQDAIGMQMAPRELAPLCDAEILVADDMPPTQKAIVRLLYRFGVGAVLLASSGGQAITQFFQHRPHLVLLDVDMPGRDGLGALRQIKEWSPSTFVALVTGVATRDNLKEAKALGVDDFLVKPISGAGLKKILDLYCLGIH